MSSATAADNGGGDRPRLVTRAAAEHYTWGSVCDGWRLVDRAELAVTLERVPPGGREVPHRHARARQFFYVLAGSAVIEADGARYALGASDGLEMPPGVAHQFLNESDADVWFLVISDPSTRGDRTDL